MPEITKPRTQKRAVELATKQANEKIDLYNRYTDELIRRLMVSLRAEMRREIAEAYPDRKDQWTYLYWKSTQFYPLYRMQVILDKYKEQMKELVGKALWVSYIVGHISFAYIADSSTPEGKQAKVKITPDHKKSILDEDFMGGNWRNRIGHLFDQIQREMERTIEQSAMQNEFLGQLRDRMDKIFGGDQALVRNSESEYSASTKLQEQMIGPADILGAMETGDMLPEYFTMPEEDWRALVEELRAAMGWERREPTMYTKGGKLAYWMEAMLNEERNRAITAGKYDAFTQNRNLINDMVWIAVVDANTSEVCFRNNLHTYTYIKEKWGDMDAELPQHPECRCAWIPEVKKWDALATDANYTNAGNPDLTVLDFDGYIGL